VHGVFAACSACHIVVRARLQNFFSFLFENAKRNRDRELPAGQSLYVNLQLALGAKAVLIGRLYMWGLAVAGEQGVRDVLLNLLADFDLTLGLSGCTSCRDFDSSSLSWNDPANSHRDVPL